MAQDNHRAGATSLPRLQPCWDGHFALNADSSEVSLNHTMRTEMRKMIQEGYWQNLAGDSAKRGTASRIGSPSQQGRAISCPSPFTTDPGFSECLS